MNGTDQQMTLDDLVDTHSWDVELFTQTKGIDVISESDLKIFFRCPYAYYLKKHVGTTKIPKSAFAGLALFFGQARKKLFNLRDPEVGRIFQSQTRAGLELKTAEEMTSNELREYLVSSAPGSFGGFLLGKWLEIAKKEYYAGSHLVWAFKEQPFHGAQQLRAAGKNYYNFVLKHGAPILGFMDKYVSFHFEGNTFLVKLPEIRKGMIIDDPTIWSFNADIPKEGRIKNNIDTSALVTLRLLAFCTLANQFPLYRLKWGIDDEIAEKWNGNPTFIDDKVTYRHFYAIKNQTASTTRDDKGLDRLRRAIDYFLEQTSREHFFPKEKFCDSCPYNTLGLDGKPVCHERKKGTKPLVPMYYLKGRFKIEIESDDEKITLIGIINKDEETNRKVSEYSLFLNRDEEIICVSSSYESYARGMGFEERIIRKADEQLQNLANSSGKPVVHKIDFVKNFKFAGQKRTAEILEQLGYLENKKEYKPK